MSDVGSIKKICGHVEIHLETHWSDPGNDGVKNLIIDAFRVEHRDGSVEFASTAQEALNMVAAHHEQSRRKVERRDPTAKVMWVTTIEWHNCPIGFRAPAFEVKS